MLPRSSDRTGFGIAPYVAFTRASIDGGSNFPATISTALSGW